jgi:hypothetical protein
VGTGYVPPGPAGGTRLAAERALHRQLSGKLRELRFYCGGQRVRISYWIAAGRRIIMLTVFTKTRMRETAEIERAREAMARCQAEDHTPDENQDEEG